MNSIKEILKKKYAGYKDDIALDGADLIAQQGFTMVPNFIFHSEKVSAFAKLVYSALLSYAFGKKNKVFPGQETLSKNVGLCKRKVIQCIQELEKAKYVTIIRRGQGRTNLYILHLKRK